VAFGGGRWVAWLGRGKREKTNRKKNKKKKKQKKFIKGKEFADQGKGGARQSKVPKQTDRY